MVDQSMKAKFLWTLIWCSKCSYDNHLLLSFCFALTWLFISGVLGYDSVSSSFFLMQHVIIHWLICFYGFLFTLNIHWVFYCQSQNLTSMQPQTELHLGFIWIWHWVVVVGGVVVVIIVGHINLTLKFGQNWVNNKVIYWTFCFHCFSFVVVVDLET